MCFIQVRNTVTNTYCSTTECFYLIFLYVHFQTRSLPLLSPQLLFLLLLYYLKKIMLGGSFSGRGISLITLPTRVTYWKIKLQVLSVTVDVHHAQYRVHTLWCTSPFIDGDAFSLRHRMNHEEKRVCIWMTELRWTQKNVTANLKKYLRAVNNLYSPQVIWVTISAAQLTILTSCIK